MLRDIVPWWARIGAKLVLSRVPADYQRWRKLNVFVHGAMHKPEYALGVFKQHFAHMGSHGRPFTALEIGPGDSVSSAVIAAAHGATRVYLIDAGMFATKELEVYRELAAYLRAAQDLQPPVLDSARDLDDVLKLCNATYGVQGLRSLREVPTESVDFIWSHAVLEHIRRNEFADFAHEMRRVLRPGGVCSHQVDLKDHLGGALNNLRISSRWWEAEWMARSGFYTNRLRMSQMVQAFESARFAVSVVAMRRWEQLPTPQKSFAREFSHLEAAELRISGFEVLLS